MKRSGIGLVLACGLLLAACGTFGGVQTGTVAVGSPEVGEPTATVLVLLTPGEPPPQPELQIFTATPGPTAPPPTPAATAAALGLVQQVLEAQVIDLDGEVIGPVDDLIISTENDLIEIVVIRRGQLLAPWEAFQVSQDEAIVFQLMVDMEGQERPPEIPLTPRNLAAPDWEADLEDYWDPLLEDIPRPESGGGAPPGESDRPAAMRLADVLNSPLFADEGDEMMGQVRDVLLEVENGTLRYLLVRPWVGFDSGERLVPVPLSALEVRLESRGLALTADRDQFAGAPSYPLEMFSEELPPGWDDELLVYWGD